MKTESLLKANKTRERMALPWVTICFTLCLLALYWSNAFLFEHLIFDRMRVEQGEWWRLWTSHWVHFNMDHLFWDLLVFAVLGAVIEWSSLRLWAGSLFASFVGVNLYLMNWAPTVQLYCGLSGVLNGWMVVAVVQQWQKDKHWMYPLLLGLTILKMIVEIITGSSLFSQTSEQMVPAAHLAGFLSGMVYVGLDMFKKRKQQIHIQIAKLIKSE